MNSQRCGLRSYKPNALINAPSQRTGTRDGGIEPALDKVYVGDAFSTADREQCKQSCQFDPKCISVTFNALDSPNPCLCVKNYGPTIRVLSLFGTSGISSCQPCP